ncbi:MAG TPA: DUF4149 domain-containing protein [Terriglobales bacterium]|nr:DUF4149 domain-containing protein [Terriglobales bacterium]
MSALRLFMLLALVVWIGGIIFFAAVVAPTLFKVLPTHQLAGAVVGRSLGILHWMGIVCGVVFLITSMLNSYSARGAAHPFAPRHLLVYIMLALTAISQFVVSAKLLAMRTAMGEIDLVPVTDARRLAFNQLHAWSTRLESGVLILGLVVLFLIARRIS